MARPAARYHPASLPAPPRRRAEMARWLTHLRAERRLSPKTVEAYARDVRQFLGFLAGHWAARVTLAALAALEARDVRAFLAGGTPRASAAAR